MVGTIVVVGYNIFYVGCCLGMLYQFTHLTPTLTTLTKGHAKIVAAKYFVPNMVSMLHSCLDWSQSLFLKGKRMNIELDYHISH